ncbi:Hypothetical protein SRAE_X000111000 [Strongyloides ratti]|uniref:Uncharacterized protein n=1 Tax=Strongyloides ratti TaxID=34506 RepID=A0A090MMV3_STRRB|nr:Hypothetical protein SRAE_X000111000 [Strongyloides ratti]CEF59361.1 Hypothetical protein SRAE_X000111000 [Strongyloides ratti]
MSGITYRERGGNRRGNKKNLPLVGFRNNRIQPQLLQQPIYPSFIHDHSNNYLTCPRNHQPFISVGQLTHPTIINGRLNMSIPPPSLAYPFLPQNIPPNGTTVAFFAQPQYLSNQQPGMRYNGTYQSYVPTISIPQNSQNSSGSQGQIPIQNFQPHQNSQPYISGIQGMTLNQPYISNHPLYTNTQPPFTTIPPLPNFQHIQPVVTVHPIPSIIPSFPGIVSQNMIPSNNSLLHPIGSNLHTLPPESNDIVSLGGVQFSTIGQSNEKKDKIKRENREKIPLKILDPNTNEEIIDTPSEVKPKSDIALDDCVKNTNNIQSTNMIVVQSRVMTPNSTLLQNQQINNQSHIISNGIYPIHYPIENHQIMPNSHYIPNSQLQRNQSNIYINAATENFNTREHNNCNGILYNNNNNIRYHTGNEFHSNFNDIDRKNFPISSINNIDSNNNNSIVKNNINEHSSISSIQESTKKISITNNNKSIKSYNGGTNTYYTNHLINNLHTHSEEENDKNISTPDNHNHVYGIKNKKRKKIKKITRDSLSYPSSVPSIFRGEHTSYRSISSNTIRNLSPFKDKQTFRRGKQSNLNEESSNLKLQNLLTYNFESLTIRNILLPSGTKQIPIIAGGNNNKNYKKTLNESSQTSQNESLVNDNYCNTTSIDLIENSFHNKNLNNNEKNDKIFDDNLSISNQLNIKNTKRKNNNDEEKLLINNENNKTDILENCNDNVNKQSISSSNVQISGESLLPIINIDKTEEDKYIKDEDNHEKKKKTDKKNKKENKGNCDKYNNQNRKKK